MLILIVVIAILATNLFLGFFVAHYLGYGPQNLDELWTGVYLRPVGPVGTVNDPQPVQRVVLDALTQAAAARPLLPLEIITPARVGTTNPSELSDGELVKTMMHANLALHQAGLLVDRLRLVDPHPTEVFDGFPSFVGNSSDLNEYLQTWQNWLQAVRPHEEIPWWKSYVASWVSTHQVWLEYQKSLSSLLRIRQAEHDFSSKLTTVVCEDGSCRLVSKQPASSSWWQRSPADLRTLSWVHSQLEQLHQEAFDHFVKLRQESRRLYERTLAWSRQTFKPDRLSGWAADFDQRWSWAGLPAVITDVQKQDGFLVVLGTRTDWVVEYSWGGVVVDALLQHRTECLNRWFASVPSVSAETILPLRQVIHDRAVAIWISSENVESARVAAWTIADRLELSHRKIDGQDIRLPCRVLVIPLSRKRPAAVAVKQAIRLLDNPDHTIWNQGGSLVWSLDRPVPQAVSRPDSLPLVESTMDLAQWYVGWRLGIGFAMPHAATVSTPTKEDPFSQPLAANSSSALANDPTSVDFGDNEPKPVDDDGIEW
jgi:hypothetical protein